MKAIGARLGADAHDPALVVAEFGGGVLSDQVEFLNSIDARRVAGLVVLVFAVENTVDQILVRLLAVAVDVGNVRS